MLDTRSLVIAAWCSCRYCAFMVKQSLSQGTRTSLHPSPGSSTSSSTTCFVSPSLSRFARQLCCRLTILIIPLYILPESIYHRYLYSPSVMTDCCLVPHRFTHNTVPLHFNHCRQHILYRIMQFKIIQVVAYSIFLADNVLCYILYIRKKLACGRSGTSALPQPM